MLEGITSAIGRFFGRHRDDEKTTTELLELDDHTLADIGLTRDEAAARENPSAMRDPADPVREIDRTGRMH